MRWNAPSASPGLLALAVALAVGVAAAPRAAAQKSTKDTLSVVAGIHQATLDPHFAITTQDLIFNRNIYNALVKFKPNSIEFEPDLATSWTVSKRRPRVHLQAPAGRRVAQGLRQVHRCRRQGLLRPAARPERPSRRSPAACAC